MKTKMIFNKNKSISLTKTKANTKINKKLKRK